MAAIFLSHSSKDSAKAEELKALLARPEIGHQSVFLDFHPEDGIPAGCVWAEELYRQLRGCRAFIILCSRASMSSCWCLAEVTHAQALKIPIFPIRIEACELFEPLRQILTQLQIIDWDASLAGRLARGLREKGLDPHAISDWSGGIPYPGLEALGAEHAAVFAGREEELERARDELNHMRLGGANKLLIAGPSGCGKSSLLCAGLLPRLRRESTAWTVLGPFRPLQDPADELAKLAHTALGGAVPFEEVRAACGGQDAGLPWLAQRFRQATASQATLVVAVDQLEESLSGKDKERGERFLHAVEHGLRGAGRDVPAVLVATIRSDSLGVLQGTEALTQLTTRIVPLSRMPVTDLEKVIRFPAAQAGVAIDDELVRTLLEEVRGEDSLPTLAYVLRKLWDRRVEGRMSIVAYQAMAGIRQAIADDAERLVGTERARHDRVRDAFLVLAQLDEQLQFRRRRAYLDDFDAGTRAIVQEYVNQRLLVSDEREERRVIEVAHEAIFREWARLRDWLGAHRSRFELARELSHAAKTWDRGKHADYLWRGEPLRRGVEYRARPVHELGEVDKSFLNASETRARAERRSRLGKVLGVVAALLVASSTAGVVIMRSASGDRRQRARLAARDFEQSRKLFGGPDPMLSFALAHQAVATVPDGDPMLPTYLRWELLLARSVPERATRGSNFEDHFFGPNLFPAMERASNQEVRLLPLEPGTWPPPIERKEIVNWSWSLDGTELALYPAMSPGSGIPVQIDIHDTATGAIRRTYRVDVQDPGDDELQIEFRRVLFRAGGAWIFLEECRRGLDDDCQSQVRWWALGPEGQRSILREPTSATPIVLTETGRLVLAGNASGAERGSLCHTTDAGPTFALSCLPVAGAGRIGQLVASTTGERLVWISANPDLWGEWRPPAAPGKAGPWPGRARFEAVGSEKWTAFRHDEGDRSEFHLANDEASLVTDMYGVSADVAIASAADGRDGSAVFLLVDSRGRRGLHVWALREAAKEAYVASLVSNFDEAALSRDGRRLATVDSKGRIGEWSLDRMFAPQAPMAGWQSAAAAFVPATGELLSVRPAADGSVRVARGSGGAVTEVKAWGLPAPNGLVLSADSQRMAVSWDDRIWFGSTRDLKLAPLPAPKLDGALIDGATIADMAFVGAGDEMLVAYARQDGTQVIARIHTTTGEAKTCGPLGADELGGFARGGGWYWTEPSDGSSTLRVYDSSSCRVLADLLGKLGPGELVLTLLHQLDVMPFQGTRAMPSDRQWLAAARGRLGQPVSLRDDVVSADARWRFVGKEVVFLDEGDTAQHVAVDLGPGWSAVGAMFHEAADELRIVQADGTVRALHLGPTRTDGAKAVRSGDWFEKAGEAMSGWRVVGGELVEIDASEWNKLREEFKLTLSLAARYDATALALQRAWGTRP